MSPMQDNKPDLFDRLDPLMTFLGDVLERHPRLFVHGVAVVLVLITMLILAVFQ